MSAEAILRDLRTDGRRVAAGSFELDAERAREKLARYQLVNPHRYVLQFVQAAVLLGAERIGIEVDADEFELLFVGDRLTDEDLRDIYLNAFSKRGRRHQDALRHLAMGIIASEGVAPALIEIDSVTPQHEGVRLSMVDGEETVASFDDVVWAAETRAIANRMKPGNRIYVRETLRPGHLVEFIRRFRWPGAAEEALRDTRYATIPIVVNQDRYSRGRELPNRLAEPIRTPLEEGFVVVERGERGGTVELVQNGVLIETATIGDGTLPVWGIVETRRLSTNLSHSAFVRNEAWRDFTDEVLAPAMFRACSRYVDGVVTVDRATATSILNAALRTRARLLGKRRTIPASLDAVCMRLADVPVWRRMRQDFDQERYVSTRELFESIGEGPVPVAYDSYRNIVVRDEAGQQIPHILRATRRHSTLDADPHALAEGTGRELADLTERLRREHVRRLRAGTHKYRSDDGFVGWPPEPSFRFLCGSTARTGDLCVAIGVPETAMTELARFHVGHRYADPATIERDVEWLRGASVAVESGAETDRDVPPADLLAQAAPTIAEALVNLALDVDPRPPPHVQARIVRGLVGGDLLRGVCAALAGEAAAESLASEARSRPVWRSLSRASASDAPLQERLEALGATVDAPLFERVRGGWLSLSEAVARPLRVIDASSERRALQIRYELELVEAKEPVVWVDGARRDILDSLVGDDGIIDYEAELRARAARIQRQRSGLREDPVLAGVFALKRSLEGPRVHGEIGLDAPDADAGIDLVLLHDGKRLAYRRLGCSFGHFRAIVEDQDLEPTDDLGDVVEDEAYSRLRERLTAVADEMFDAWCRKRLVEPTPLSDGEELAIWRAILAATEDADSRSEHRLDWPVFWLANGRRVSLLELRDECGESVEFVTGHVVRPGDTVVVQLPAAPGARPSLLSRLLPDVSIRQIDTKLGASVTLANGTKSPTRDAAGQAPDHTPSLATLAELLGNAIELTSLELGDGEGRPTHRGGDVRLPRQHFLVNELVRGRGDTRHATLIAIILLADDPHALSEIIRATSPPRDA